MAKVRAVTELLPSIHDPHTEYKLLQNCLGLLKVMLFLLFVYCDPSGARCLDRGPGTGGLGRPFVFTRLYLQYKLVGQGSP